MQKHKNWIIAGVLLLLGTLDLSIDLLSILLNGIKSSEIIISITRLLLLFYVSISIKAVAISFKRFESDNDA